MAEKNGLVHLYYGDGKGKTTAAFGLAFRCAGRGNRVIIAQFLKGSGSGEVAAAERFPEITQLRGRELMKFTFQMNEEEKRQTAADMRDLFHRAVNLAVTTQPRLLVLDEVIDVFGSFLPAEDLTLFLDNKPDSLEVVLTGHSLPEALAQRADYITRMAKERHPFDRGLMAREDIEY